MTEIASEQMLARIKNNGGEGGGGHGTVSLIQASGGDGATVCCVCKS